MDDRRQTPAQTYVPPRLLDLGTVGALTKSVPVGKLTGGPDAFGLVGRGVTTSSA